MVEHLIATSAANRSKNIEHWVYVREAQFPLHYANPIVNME
jgi:hypothetical protein